jgi:cytochrome b561
MDTEARSSSAETAEAYTPTARRYHWFTVAFIAIQVPLGLYMVTRGETTNFDAITGTLYDSHKLLGFLILLLVIARLIYRFSNGAPPDEPTLEPWQKAASHLNHWGLYGLLLAVPLLGWVGVSLYGARSIFGLFSLPPLASQNQDSATLVFLLHKWAAYLLIAMAAVHIAAALFHHLIRRDGVLRRMLPELSKRS